MLFCGKFGLTESAFQEGLERGDFFEVESADGRMTYGWQQDEQATTRGTSSKMEVAASKKLSKEELQVENIAMGSWQSGLFKKKNVKALEGGETPMAIEDQKAELSERAWNAAQKQLLDAQKAMGEQIRAGKKLLQLVGVDNKADPLYHSLTFGFCLVYPFLFVLPMCVQCVSKRLIKFSIFYHKRYGFVLVI